MASSFIKDFFLYANSVGSLKNGHVFGVMADGDEFFFRIRENGGRLKVDSVLVDFFREEIRRKRDH